MNKTIENFKYEDLLFFDIETVKGTNDFSEDSLFYDVWAWKFRNTDTNELKESKEVIELYNTKAALYPEWGKIVCISVGFIHEDELHTKSFIGKEEDLLKDFIEMVKTSGRKLVAHNGIKFDLPFVRKRWTKHNLGEYLNGKQGNDVYQKPWELDEAVFDTMVAWKGTSFNNTSLDELAMVFGIPSSKDTMKGNEVSKYYYEGKIKEIAKYCEEDVRVLANVVRCWKGDSILNKSDKKEELVEKTVLQKLYAYNDLTDEIKEEITERVKKAGKLSKEDKNNLYQIIRGVYVRTDFANNDQDSKTVVKEKEAEILDFLESIL